MKNQARPITVQAKKISRKALDVGRVAYPPSCDNSSPQSRGDCVNMPRPCPFVGCKHNLYLDANACGSIKFNFPDMEPDEMEESCVLDIADKGRITLDIAGQMMNITRERVRQIENRALAKVRQYLEATQEDSEIMRLAG